MARGTKNPSPRRLLWKRILWFLLRWQIVDALSIVIAFNMRYAAIFSCLAICLVAVAIQTGGWTWILLWPAVSVLLIALGYARLGARVFGKRRDGAYARWGVVLHGPYLLSTLGVWYLIRWTIAENAADEISPGIWVARRPLAIELPEGAAWIVDVTAEFWVARGVRGGRNYACYPTLDGHVCDDAAFALMVREVAELQGGILIHCAQGHGRSVALAAAVLVARGVVENVAEAEKILIDRRPKVGMKKGQRWLVERWYRDFLGNSEKEKDPHPALSRSTGRE